MERLEKMIEKANKALQEVKDYLQENENAFLYMNLKLYNAFYECDKLLAQFPLLQQETDASDIFYAFCENEYDCFVDILQYEHDIKFSPYHLGHTSSFTLHDRNTIIIEGRRYGYEINYSETIYNLLEYDTYCDIGVNVDCTICKEDIDFYLANDEMETVKADLQYIASGKFLQYVKEYCKDIITQYEYIKAEKDNQVDGLKDYMEYRNDIIEYDLQQAEKQDLEIWLDGVNAIFA